MSPREVKVDSDLRLDPEALLEKTDWAAIFGGAGPVEVEIGIGKGRFMLAAAEARPNVFHLGIEWANKYLRIAEKRAVRRGLENVRFVRGDAKELVCRAFPEASVTTYYLFYPDPWPKARHNKRRFVQKETLDHVARTLVGGGWLHVATDHAEYWEWILERIEVHEAFERQPRFGGADFPLPVDAPLTNFEAKYDVEGRGRHRGSWRKMGTFPKPPNQGHLRGGNLDG